MFISFLQNCASRLLHALTRLKKNRPHPYGINRIMRIWVAISFSFILTLNIESNACAVVDPPPLNPQLEKIIGRELPQNCEVSCQVAELNSGRILMEKNPDLALTPASTLKIVTSATALSALGPDFRFITQIFTDRINGGSVGNLFVKGHGDPHLVTEELFSLVRELIDRGLTEVNGSIVVDDSFFTPDTPLDEAEELGFRSYHAPYSALSLNFNSLKIAVIPGSTPGSPSRLIMDPMSGYASLSGHVQTISGGSPLKIEISKKPATNGTEHIMVEGSIGAEAPAKGKYVNVQFPALYTGNVLKDLLIREGIKVQGNVVKGQTPSAAKLYLEHQSMPLGLIVYWLDKLSNNFMAEQICLALGAFSHGAPGTREKGLDMMRKFLIQAGAPKSSFFLADASGLSRSNKISASALVRTLAVSSQDYYTSPEFISSLGISGVDGTLREKFTDKGVRGKIRAKTGTLRGVNALAGYGLDKNGAPVVFAILVNCGQKGVGIIDYADKIMRSIFSAVLNRQ